MKTEFFPSSDSDYLYVNIEAPVGLSLEESDKIVKEVESRLLKYKEINNFNTIIGSSASSFGALGGGSSSSHLSSISIKLFQKRGIKSYKLGDKIREDLSDIMKPMFQLIFRLMDQVPALL